jgi:hypothetical protein
MINQKHKLIGVRKLSDGKNYFVSADSVGKIYLKRTKLKTWEQLYPQHYKTKEEWEEIENETNKNN